MLNNLLGYVFTVKWKWTNALFLKNLVWNI